LGKQQEAERARIQQQIEPLATALMSLGLDPQMFLNSPLGQSIISQGRGAISNEFGQARQNLWESLGSSGMAGSGVGVGPMANLFGQEASAQANLIQMLPQLGAQFGMQGAGLLQGQQGLLNPLGFLGTGIGGFNSLQQGQWGKNILGAVGAALGGMGTGGLKSLVGGGGPGPAEFGAEGAG